MAASKQASKHTHARDNAVTLVWGSLRLAPNMPRLAMEDREERHFLTIEDG